MIPILLSIHSTIKPDGFHYHQMILVYLDDILHLSHDPNLVINSLHNMYELKEGSIGPPTKYLGTNIEHMQLEDVHETWAMTSKDYIHSTIDGED
jgi:hypothetical protein